MARIDGADFTLKAEASKPRKHRRSLKQIHLATEELGYDGSYDRVAAFPKQWKAGQTEWIRSPSKPVLIAIEQ